MRQLNPINTCSKCHFPYKMTITLLRMYLFKIWQMQKIEQVMPEVTVILQELETFKIFFKNTIYCKICMRPWIRRVSTPQNFNIFGFCQIQKIEQVYAVHNMTLPAPETFKIFFKNTIYWKKTENLHATLDSQAMTSTGWTDLKKTTKNKLVWHPEGLKALNFISFWRFKIDCWWFVWEKMSFFRKMSKN